MTYWPCEDAPEIAEAKRLVWLSSSTGIPPVQLMKMQADDVERLGCALQAIDYDAHMRREFRRLLRTLPLRTRLRLGWRKHLTTVGEWLLDHGHDQATVRLWRLTGLWH